MAAACVMRPGLHGSSRSHGDLQSLEVIEDHYAVRRRRQGLPQQYSKGRFLGKGGFAKCYEVQDLLTKSVYAAKVVSKASVAKPRAMAKLKSEIAIHRSLDHEKVVKFYDYFEDPEFVYIILELCPSQTLNDLMRKRPCRRLSEPEAMFYLYDLANGIRYLHRRRVIHRDLKLGNLFLDKDMHIKIGDFGLAAQLEYDGERKRTVCGTPNYIAPEILEGRDGHSYEVDIWSIGVILYTMVVGRPPFETTDVKTTYRRIRRNEYSFPEAAPVSDSARGLVMSILRTDPRARPSLEEIQAAPWFRASPLPPPPPPSLSAAVVSAAAPSAAAPSPRIWLGGASARSETPDRCGADFARLESPAPPLTRLPFQDRAPGSVPTPQGAMQLQRAHSASRTPALPKQANQPCYAAPATPGRFVPACGPPCRPPLAHWACNDENAAPVHSNIAGQRPMSPCLRQPRGGGSGGSFPPMLSCGSAGHLGHGGGSSARSLPVRAAVCQAPRREGSPFARVLSSTGAGAGAGAAVPVSSRFVPYSATPRSSAGSPRSSQPPPNLAAACRLAAAQTPRAGFRGFAEQGGASSSRSTAATAPAPATARAESVQPSDLAAPAGVPATSRSYVPPVWSKDNPFALSRRDSDLTDTRAPSSSSFLPPRSSASSARSAGSSAASAAASDAAGPAALGAAPAPRRRFESGASASSRSSSTPAMPPAQERAGSSYSSDAGQGTALAAAAAAAAAAASAAACAVAAARGPLAGGRASPAVPPPTAPSGVQRGNVRMPEVWVTRWIDYSSKYGVGYMLSDGSVGVFFNDSTKIVLVPDGRSFDYVTRRTHDRPEVLSTYTFEDFPQDLKKKVTLLRHFKNYMLIDALDEKDACAPLGESSLPAPQLQAAGASRPAAATVEPQEVTYVKKWTRTRSRQAVMFQLSNKMVQVLFVDKSEALLSSREHFVTYVDKRGQIASYPLNSSLEVPNEELQRRLHYTKEILAQTLGVQRVDDRAAAHGGT